MFSMIIVGLKLLIFLFILYLVWNCLLPSHFLPIISDYGIFMVYNTTVFGCVSAMDSISIGLYVNIYWQLVCVCLVPACVSRIEISVLLIQLYLV